MIVLEKDLQQCVSSAIVLIFFLFFEQWETLTDFVKWLGKEGWYKGF